LIVLIATLQIIPEHREEFISAMLEDAKGSVSTESGCIRFDVLQDSSDPSRLHLYEVYRDEAALDTHANSPHLIKWRETVKDWYAAPIEFSISSPIFPPENSWKDVQI
jgi:quinol monooxygenase YgiN